MKYAWGRERPFNDMAGHYRKIFGARIQKLSINAGFTCPNRDGTKGTGGCTFCNNQTFNPEYCHTGISIKEQIERGISFFSGRKVNNQFLAYFQAYTNTYAADNLLFKLYEEALDYPLIKGLVIGTRPDCINNKILEFLKEYQNKGYYISIEYGIESTLDRTLLRINRGHSYQDSINAIEKTASYGIPVGAHLILGLPGETDQDILNHAKELSKLPLESIKLHQLQLVTGTRMAEEFISDSADFRLYGVEEYIQLAIQFTELLKPEIAIERFVSQSPTNLLIAPTWGLKNHELVHKIEKK